MSRGTPKTFVDDIAERIYGSAIKKGFWDCEERDLDLLIGTKLNMIVTEVSEVTEAYRKDKGKEGIIEEIADIVIRVLDLYYGLASHGFVDKNSLEPTIYDKMEVNRGREFKHGRRF